jgi:hypothetical protein
MGLGIENMYIRNNDKGCAGGFDLSIINGGANTASSVTLNTPSSQTGGNSSAILNGLKNLAVPAGLLYLQQSLSRNYLETDKDEPISDSLYDKLFNLASFSDSSNKSATHKKTRTNVNNKKTRKKPVKNS